MKRKFSSSYFTPGRHLPSLAAGMVNGILIVIFQSAYAALIFSGKLSGYVANGVGLMLFGAFVMGIVVAVTSSFHSTVTAPQDAPTAIMALVSAAIAANLSAAESGEVVFITVMMAMAITSLFAGIFLLALGWFKLGNLIRFIPYPVVGGFLAGTGWILIKGAVGIMADIPLKFSTLNDLMPSEIFLKWSAGLLFALLLFAVLRRIHHFLVLPGMVVFSMIIFYAILFLTGTTITEAGDGGWLLARFSGGVAWQPVALSSLAKADFAAILHQAGNLGTIVMISVISLLLNASGLELIARQEIDLNRELRSTGIANLLAGLGGSSVGYMSLSLTALGYRVGARSRLSGFISAGLCGVTLLFGAGIASYFPKFLLGGLLAYLGLSFLVEWLYNAWFRLPRNEYILVILILAAIAWLGFLPGVVLGVLIALVLFVLNYSRIDVVKHVLTGETFHSNVDRAASYQRLLSKNGNQLYILKLQGYIFFGTANNILDQVKQRANTAGETPLRFVVLDFRLVSGLDSSALNSFEKMKLLSEAKDFILVFTGMLPDVQRLFEKGGVIQKENSRLQIFPDLDHGVEWIENQILAAVKKTSQEPFQETHGVEFLATLLGQSPASVQNTELPEMAANRLMKYLKRFEVQAGSYLIRQGSPPSGLYIIESGQVTAQIEPEHGKVIRLRTMRSGTVIGELGVYLGLPATASVIANRNCTVFYLSLEKLKGMEKAEPETASAFHQFIARILGERVVNSNKTLQALMK